MINMTCLTGRLTKDPVLKRTNTGKDFCQFTLAVNRRYNPQGQTEADFINCVAWNKTAEVVAQHLHKGSLIGVEGRISTRNYENNQGQRVYVTEVIASSVAFLEPRKDQGYQQDYQGGYQGGYGSSFQGAYSPQNTPIQSKGYSSLDEAFMDDDLDGFVDDPDLPF